MTTICGMKVFIVPDGTELTHENGEKAIVTGEFSAIKDAEEIYCTREVFDSLVAEFGIDDSPIYISKVEG